MAFSSEIIAKLGLDTQMFTRGFATARSQVDKFGDDVGKTLRRKLGAGDMFRGLLQGLGIGSAQQIADTITKPWAAAAKSAQEIEASTSRTLAMLERELERKNSPEQNLSLIERRIQSESAVLAGLQQRLAGEKGSLFNRGLGVFGVESGEVSELRAQVQQQTELVNALGARQRESIEQIAATARKNAADLAAAEKAYGEAKLRRLAAEGDAQADVQLAGQRYADAMLAAQRAGEGTADRFRALAIVEERRLALSQAEAKAQSDKQQAVEKERREQERILSLRQQVLTAERAVGSARAALANLPAERLSFTLAEAAAGTRGSSAAQLAARRVQELEAQARRMADSGSTITQFDSATQRNVRLTDKDVLARADALRLGGIAGLNAEERDPAKALKDALRDAETTLKEISSRLAPAQIK